MTISSGSLTTVPMFHFGPTRNKPFEPARHGFDYPKLPVHLVQQADDLNRPRIAVAMSTAHPKAATEDTFHGHQHAQRPAVDAKRSNPAHKTNRVGAITDRSVNDENAFHPSLPRIDDSESSESDYDTPDFDESSGAGEEDREDTGGLGWVGM